MRLPPELRLLVYERISRYVRKPVPGCSSEPGIVDLYVDYFPTFPAILQVSRLITREASPVVQRARKNHVVTISCASLTGLSRLAIMLERGYVYNRDTTDPSPSHHDQAPHNTAVGFSPLGLWKQRLAKHIYTRDSAKNFRPLSDRPIIYPALDLKLSQAMDAFYHWCIATLRTNPVFRVRRLLPSGKVIADPISISKKLSVLHLQIIYVAERGFWADYWYAKWDYWHSDESREIDWNMHTMLHEPVLGVD